MQVSSVQDLALSRSDSIILLRYARPPGVAVEAARPDAGHSRRWRTVKRLCLQNGVAIQVAVSRNRQRSAAQGASHFLG